LATTISTTRSELIFLFVAEAGLIVLLASAFLSGLLILRIASRCLLPTLLATEVIFLARTTHVPI
jgi:hypothetical protein